MGMDYYNILRVNRNATNEECRKAYRRLAMIWHPDKHRGDKQVAEAKFKEISEAYDVLSDPKKRAIYDEYGEEGLKGNAPSCSRSATSYPAGTSGQNIYPFNSRNAEEIFAEAFLRDFDLAFMAQPKPRRSQTGARKSQGVNVGAANMSQKAPGIERKLECSLEELYTGSTRKINLSRKVITSHGESVTRSETVVIDVKPGWKKGTKITFPKMGDEEVNMIPGDMVFEIDENPHAVYTRVGNDLVVQQKLSLADAIGGTTFKLHTLDDRELTVQLANIVSPGYELLIANEGMPIAREPGSKGHLRIKFDVIFPSTLTEEQRSGIRNILER
ncbi:dnaJ homolog subfamily B member 1-like [Phalaenopsis equestris]|uniref:dnaJ homolog subfamily B member 1-like n=1 Tax=Phalaenopsis equestris TaxID=78828 RepID=UPI0009E57BE3|nr:dnaJ homolog subfamily B member 1-like [Phalaenopsis equestris]